MNKREDMPGVTQTTEEDSMPTLTGSSDSWTTPAITVPANADNPYIIRQHNPTGTVFIAVGVIVGFILLSFIGYHLFKSLRASFLAKRASESDRMMYEKYQNNNNMAYGNSLGYNSDFQPSVSKLPLLSHSRSRSLLNGLNYSSQGGDTSTIYASDTGAAVSKNDLTKMFISPTAEVMTHKRNKSGNLINSSRSVIGASTTNLANPNPATSRHSQLIPNLYLSNEVNSEYSLATRPLSATKAEQDSTSDEDKSNTNRAPRRAIPSMYLEDLIEK